MTPRQILLVQDSFAMLAPHRQHAAELFHMRLFYLHPRLRLLFPADLDTQGRKLMQVLGTIVRWLDQSDQIRDSLADLGRRHVAYGVQPEDYAAVGEALGWAFEEVLGKSFNGEIRDAWAAAFDLVRQGMLARALTPLQANAAIRAGLEG